LSKSIKGAFRWWCMCYSISLVSADDYGCDNKSVNIK
jgi:hypothetical protein